MQQYKNHVDQYKEEIRAHKRAAEIQSQLVGAYVCIYSTTIIYQGRRKQLPSGQARVGVWGHVPKENFSFFHLLSCFLMPFQRYVYVRS